MRSSLRVVATLAVLLGVALLPSAARAAPASSIFGVSGVEIAASSTQGTFTGKASGSAGDTGAWKAVVVHEPLSSQPAAITGGSFEMGTVGPGFTADYVKGSFAGGSVAVVDPGAGCKNQTFSVKGTLANVSTSTTTGGTGAADIVLTHYRRSVFGYCVTYSATVTGLVQFSY